MTHQSGELFMRIFTMAALAAATLPLAACLGGGGDSDGDLPENFEEIADLYDAAEAGELDEASEEMMSGTATLAGAIAFEDLGEGGELEAIGELSLTADFTNDEVTGTADNFALYVTDTDEVEATLSGSLGVDGDITGTTMTATLEGDLKEGGASNIVDMTMVGTFYEYDSGLAVAGDVTGTIDGNEADGGFAAIEE
ncbi:hypothetical protein Q4494_15400 [Celeribacter halophilus]|uniref:Transferrin-binding protein B C-lobe/N-lobe beta barrel domain-containing protein n=1 Tax=Celeribacter halophilus TaxID=576117 RepID=A0AAW7XVM2_9RHOB|nr:hypothetical protein [Celeribacter halophilus]MDO6458473.1 hypothetical protein [Celeribacter halophilus]